MLRRPALAVKGSRGAGYLSATPRTRCLLVVDADAEQFARLAVELHEQPHVAQTVEAVVDWAVPATAADAASVMLLHGTGRHVEIAGVTNAAAATADELQVELGQGPCLAAAIDQDDKVIRDTLTDQRWPDWSRRIAAELCIRCVLSLRLGTPVRAGRITQPLRLHTRCFDRDDISVGHVLARHAVVALAQARQELTLEQAMDSRKIIGIALGLLMERYDLDADQAFAVLRRYSQDNNIKLRAVAERLIATRRLPGHTAAPSS